MRVIEVDMIDHAGLAIAHDDRLAEQVLLGGMQFAEDVYSSFRANARPTHAPHNGFESWIFQVLDIPGIRIQQRDPHGSRRLQFRKT